MSNIYMDLPKVVRITSVTDAGEATATCPTVEQSAVTFIISIVQMALIRAQ